MTESKSTTDFFPGDCLTPTSSFQISPEMRTTLTDGDWIIVSYLDKLAYSTFALIIASNNRIVFIITEDTVGWA